MNDKTILILSPDYPSEHGEFNGSNAVKNQLAYSKKMFKKVIVIVPVLKTGGITPQDKYCHDYSYDNVDVYFPRCFFLPRIIKIPGVSNYTKVSIDSRLFATLDTIKTHNLTFDLIHAHFTYPSAFIASELKKRFPVPVISTIHEDSGWFEEERKMNHPRFVQAWNSADLLTRVNTTELSILKQYNPNVVHVPGGYDPESYTYIGKVHSRKLLNLPQTDKMVFAFGFLDERKGFQDLIAAIAHLPAQYSAVKCYISGNGYYKTQLESLIKEFGLEKRVFLISRLVDKDVAVWINAADLFIMPSLRESFGSTQIEALGCGTPVIASDNVGSIDIINDTCGYLFKIGDSLDLSSQIINGLTTHWDTAKILDYAKNKYAWNVVSKQFDKFYTELMNR